MTKVVRQCSTCSAEYRSIERVLGTSGRCKRCAKRCLLIVKCPGCGLERIADSRYPQCKSCAATGKNNPNWKNGGGSGLAGRFGRDGAGLSWKKQRKLALERDGYRCCDCGKTAAQLGRNPDVDHVVPYRVSLSHNLDNLMTRCHSCHMTAEASREAVWGGVRFGGAFRQLRSQNVTPLHHTGTQRCFP